MKRAKSRDKSRVIKENQIDLPGFSVFELFDQLAEYYQSEIWQRTNNHHTKIRLIYQDCTRSTQPDILDN